VCDNVQCIGKRIFEYSVWVKSLGSMCVHRQCSTRWKVNKKEESEGENKPKANPPPLPHILGDLGSKLALFYQR
jgi:hypothetical protein